MKIARPEEIDYRSGFFIVRGYLHRLRCRRIALANACGVLPTETDVHPPNVHLPKVRQQLIAATATHRC